MARAVGEYPIEKQLLRIKRPTGWRRRIGWPDIEQNRSSTIGPT